MDVNPYRESNHCNTPTANASQYTMMTSVTDLCQSRCFRRNAISNDVRHARPETKENTVWNTYSFWNPTVIHPNIDTHTNAGRNRKKPKYLRADRSSSRGLHNAYNTKNTGAMGVQYGIATPNLVPSTGNATNAATNSRSLEPYIKTFFSHSALPCFI